MSDPPPPPTMPPGRRPRGALRASTQLVIFGASIGAFVWVFNLAFSESNRERLAQISEPDPALLGALIAFTAASIVVNGLIFRALVRPIGSVRATDLVAVNAVATFLAILPFKIGLLTRVLIHNKRDGIRLPDIMRWFVANAAITIAVLLPIWGVSWWRGRADAVWWVGVLAGPALCVAAGVLLCRAAERIRLLGVLSLGSHVILRDGRAALGAFALRIADVAFMALRFLAAASLAGVEVEAGQAAFLGVSFFLVSVIAPSGAQAFQVAGTVGIGALLGMDAESSALVGLVVVAAEVGTAAVMALAGFWLLRLDRLILDWRRTPRRTPGGSPTPGAGSP